MLPVKTLVRRIRTAVHDKDEITYSDDEIVDVINAAVRFIRRTIAEYRPEMLASKATGVLEAGNGTVTLDTRPLKFIVVRAGSDVVKVDEVRSGTSKIYHNRAPVYNNHDRVLVKITNVITYREVQLQEVNASEIADASIEDEPQVFYQTGLSDVNFYPIPQQATGYEISYIKDIEELTIADESPLLTEFDDFIVEYAQTRLSIDNEYDASQDSQVMSSIYNQIVERLHVPPYGETVMGYWDAPRGWNRYGRRVRRW